VGRWGQHDLAGSVAEWSLDAFGTYPLLCEDCAIIEDVSGFSLRYFRGGSWADDASALAMGERQAAPATVSTPFWGIRCARDAALAAPAR
jgi:formylglycine-generating enzyme required for sulfatase activity